MRLPNGTLLPIAKKLNCSSSYISSVVKKRINISYKRAKELEVACSELGLQVSKDLWLTGSIEEIEKALSSY